MIAHGSCFCPILTGPQPMLPWCDVQQDETQVVLTCVSCYVCSQWQQPQHAVVPSNCDAYGNTSIVHDSVYIDVNAYW